jgi:septum formation inhibitor-activating ATPase MinD
MSKVIVVTSGKGGVGKTHLRQCDLQVIDGQ